MYRSILVPLDGSEAAEHALPMAVNLARRFGASLKIVHVHVPVVGNYGEAGWYDGIVDTELREQMQTYLDDVVHRISEVADVSVRAELLNGLVAAAINRYATESGVDLIVMTTQGRGPVARFWLGSVADALVRQSTIPMLFVRPQESEADLTSEPNLGRVLILLDGSPLAEQIIEPAATLAAATKAEVTLLRVVQQFTPDNYASGRGRVSGIRPALLKQLQEVDSKERAQAEDYLGQVAEQLRSRSLNIATQIVSDARPASAILDVISAHGADLIALATQGRGGLKRLLMGSVADKVLRGAPAPVLVYRPVGEHSTAEE